MSTQGSLADRITGILNSAPKSFDPEDDDVDNTCAQTVSFLEDVDKSDNESNQTQEISKKRPFNYLMDTDERYSGKKKSRKSLRESDGEDSYEDEEGSISGNSKSGRNYTYTLTLFSRQTSCFESSRIYIHCRF